MYVIVELSVEQVVVSFAAGMPREGESTDTGGASSSVEDVAFSPSLPLALTASLSGAVGVWDIPTQKLRHKLQHQVHVYSTFVHCPYKHRYIRYVNGIILLKSKVNLFRPGLIVNLLETQLTQPGTQSIGSTCNYSVSKRQYFYTTLPLPYPTLPYIYT